MEIHDKTNTEKLLTMSLDEISKMNEKKASKTFDKNRNYHRKDQRKYVNVHKNYQNNKDYKISQHNNNWSRQQFNKFDLNNPTRIEVRNLHKGVDDKELLQLFQAIGKVKRCGIRKNDKGESLGEADVEYYTPRESKRAVEYFNNAEIEGVYMSVQYNFDNNYTNTLNTKPRQKRVFRHRLQYKKN